MSNFKKKTEETFKKLDLFVPTVDRVHGDHHPEFHEVTKLYEAIRAKRKAQDLPDLGEEFKSLRAITEDYTVPSDVCESYEAVFLMLKEVEKDYFQEKEDTSK